jgi:hypothetical protein
MNAFLEHRSARAFILGRRKHKPHPTSLPAQPQRAKSRLEADFIDLNNEHFSSLNNAT